jgi:hypothetical protein
MTHAPAGAQRAVLCYCCAVLCIWRSWTLSHAAASTDLSTMTMHSHTRTFGVVRIVTTRECALLLYCCSVFSHGSAGAAECRLPSVLAPHTATPQQLRIMLSAVPLSLQVSVWPGCNLSHDDELVSR